MKSDRTWILIADAGRARVLESLGVGKGARVVDGLASESNLPSTTHEIVADRQPRAQDSAGPSRHAIEPKTDPRDQLKQKYLEMLAASLDARFASGDFEKLIVVAPPTALGILRSALSDRLRAAVAAEVAKDLTKTPDQELASHLADHIRL